MSHKLAAVRGRAPLIPACREDRTKLRRESNVCVYRTVVSVPSGRALHCKMREVRKTCLLRAYGHDIALNV